MAPTSSADASSAPLADYFFICGIESSQVYDERAQPVGLSSPLSSPPPVDVDETIEEDRALETDSVRPKSQEGLSNGDGTQRRSARLSFDHRNSVSTIIGPDSKLSASNRSSATIKGIQQLGGSGLSDADFEVALRKFASERDTFLEDLQFTAGVAQQNRPTNATRPPRPRPQRVQHEEVGNLRSGVGSIRRRLSTMSSLKRQPSMARQASIRTSKRMSGYNSVIPTPQPFNSDPTMHPLLRRYEPVLLDRYPPKAMVEELKRRNPFPDYVPMFAFPNDVNVVSSDDRPKTTWHGFAMTNGDGSKLYGISMIIWQPLNASAAEGLERQCEEWRRNHMNAEERELASSLGERLALERAKLSQLLAKLSKMGQEVEVVERENLEEEISAVEEKIGLMTDLLRPVRHGAASRIEGLTSDGATGLWIPRAYGVMGRDATLTPFWKEWLKAVMVPMTDGTVLRVPSSSPRVGLWQPLERYVVNLCAEALSPITSITQVEITVRDLRLYARKEAVNELPGSRNIDLYALFRCLSIPNIVTLFESVLQESRIILLSSHTAMLHLASAAIINLLYPFQWAGVFIPVLPSRLIQTIEAPCPYIVGIERRYEPVDFPEDDYVLVDLDCDTISTNGDPPTPLPRQQRRKLTSLLQHSAPHHTRYGVPTGPPQYAVESYPLDTFCSENPGVFTARAQPSNLPTYVGLNSTSFGTVLGTNPRPLIFNAFLQSGAQSRGNDRPSTATTIKTESNSPPSPRLSPISQVFPPMPSTPISRSDSGYALQASLREKRSAHFETSSRRSSSVSSSRAFSFPGKPLTRLYQFGFDRMQPVRRPSQPFSGHAPSMSTSSLSHELRAGSSYAPSVYAQSTLAASTIMPGLSMQPVRNTETTHWQEGHCLQWKAWDEKATCSVCNEKSDEGIYRCTGCSTFSHGRCVTNICMVCPSAFRPDQVRASFVRCFASLLYTYRRYLLPASGDQKKAGMIYRFKMDDFLKSMPHENVQYVRMLQQTQAFNEFIHERESTRADDPSIRLFDEVILAKRNRGRSSFFHKQKVDFLSDTTDHLWRSAAATPPNTRLPADWRAISLRIPAKLDPTLMKEPRVIQGVPRIPMAKARRKPIPSMLGPNGHA